MPTRPGYEGSIIHAIILMNTGDHRGQGEHEQAPIISYTCTVHKPMQYAHNRQYTIHIQAFSWATHISIEITQSCPKLFTLLALAAIYILI